MLSYKNWKLINESFVGDAVLGIISPQSFLVSDAPASMSTDEVLEEMKKKLAKAKKKMNGDGEIVRPSAIKDADPDADKKAALDSEEGDSETPDPEGHEDAETPEEEEGEHEEGDEGEDDETPRRRRGEPTEEAPEDDAGSATEMMMKKKMKKDGKCSKCNKMPCKCKKMKKEEEDNMNQGDQAFFDSIRSMIEDFPSAKGWDGISEPSEIKELNQAVREEPGKDNPQPGQVGYAPKGRLNNF
jgi:hypothetical protein